MSKYAPLAAYLRSSGQDSLTMSFDDVGRIIGATLPESARHRAWWSNNPTNSVMTRAWLDAGYKTEKVDMAGKTLVFVKTGHYPSAPSATGQALEDAAKAAAAAQPASFSFVFGALEGTVTVMPGTDLTAPVEAEWEAAT